MNKPLIDKITLVNPASVAKKPASGWQRARLLLPVLLCLSGACAQTPKRWQAHSQLLVRAPTSPVSGSPVGSVPSWADDSMETQIVLLQNTEMAQRTIAVIKNESLIAFNATPTAPTENENVILSLTPGDVQKAVRATNLPGTRILVITAEDNNPERARVLANAAARAFVEYKRDLATRDMMGNQRNLELQVARAGRAMDRAERQERAFRQASPRQDEAAQKKAVTGQATNASHPDSASRLKENTEIATELYRQLETALEATRLRSGLVSGDVVIAKYADLPTVPSS